MLHALLFAVAIGPEHFAGEPALQPLRVETRLLAASNGHDLAIASEGEALTLFRVDPSRLPATGVRPVTGATVHDLAGNAHSYAAVWTRGPEFGPSDVGLTIVDSAGIARTLVLERQNRRAASASVASDGRNYLAAWDNGSELHCRLFDESGTPLGPMEVYRTNSIFGATSIASNGDGFVIATIVPGKVISIRVASDGKLSTPADVTTQGGQFRAFEWFHDHYLLITGLGGFARGHRLDADGRPLGPPVGIDVDPRNAVRQGDFIVGEYTGKLYRIDANGTLETITNLALPPRSIVAVWTLASNGVDLFFVGGDPGAPARMLRLGGADQATTFGLVVGDQAAPQVARAAGVHAVVWREGIDWYVSRVRGGLSLDGRGAPMPLPPAVASDGARRLMLFAGNGAWPIPLSGPLPIVSGVFGEQPVPTWTGTNFVSVTALNLGRTACLWERKQLHATVVAPDGKVLQPATPLGVDGNIELLSVVGTGDGFVLAWRDATIAGCSSRYFWRTQSISPDLQKRTDLYPATAFAADDDGTTVFSEDAGLFANGKRQGKVSVKSVFAAWSGTTFVLAKQTANGIEVARWDPQTQPLVQEWAALDPQLATSDPTATLTGLASSASGAVLVYTRIVPLPGWGDWRRVALRELDASPARRRVGR